MQATLQDLVKAAQEGSKDALQEVIQHMQGMVYNLAIRMLRSPADAEDATQEILIRMMTHLGQFSGESSFSTWVYRLASNSLLNIVRRDAHHSAVSFDTLSEQLETSLALYQDTPEALHEDAILIEEVKRSCTLGMLMCLNVEDRLALVLGELFEVSSDEGAAIMGISSAAYRKRLSRARQQLVNFVSHKCGLVNPENPCRCHKHVRNKIAFRLLDPAQLQFVRVGDPLSVDSLIQHDSDALCRTVALLRAHPSYVVSTDFAVTLRQMLAGDGADFDAC
jgi:RNA polymerase sigma factor (sigma-70 family)